MENLKKVHATKDNDGHWYVIPVELVDEFNRLLDGGEATEDEFIEKFSEYMTGGDLNLVQLYAEIKQKTIEQDAIIKDLRKDNRFKFNSDTFLVTRKFIDDDRPLTARHEETNELHKFHWEGLEIKKLL